ncbi:MAG: quinone-interacting membrane-bound oxidoreductase complex subunit QmoC [Bacteroidales bacterium]
MTELKPDIAFKRELEKISGASLSTCMQCGTCSVVCNLSPEEKPFPRKEMLYAGWGMRSALIAGNPDVWLCHQCGDCTTHCPRGVNPADVLAAIRDIAYRSYAVPGFIGKILSKPALLPVAILFPVVIIATIIYLAGTHTVPDLPVNYSKFFPHVWLNSSFTILTLISYSLAAIGFSKFWNDLNNHPLGKHVERKRWFPSLWKVKNDIMLHSRFDKCGKNKHRKIAHLLVFYGFLILLLVTLYAIYASVAGKYPLQFTNPFKILGNVAGLMLFTGLGLMVLNRLREKEDRDRSSYADWLFIGAMMLLTLSGIVIELARFMDWSSAYYLYFFHLVCVWFVIIYLPYTKFGHIIYRTVAMTYAFSIDRKVE